MHVPVPVSIGCTGQLMQAYVLVALRGCWVRIARVLSMYQPHLCGHWVPKVVVVWVHVPLLVSIGCTGQLMQAYVLVALRGCWVRIACVLSMYQPHCCWCWVLSCVWEQGTVLVALDVWLVMCMTGKMGDSSLVVACNVNAWVVRNLC